MRSLGAILRAAREEIPGLSFPFDFGGAPFCGFREPGPDADLSTAGREGSNADEQRPARG